MEQDVIGSMAYISGIPRTIPDPLSRYLPQIPIGIISRWLHKNVPEGSWILDPFGTSPRLAVEAARAGYKILITAHNPIARFLIEMASNPPNQA